MGINVAFEIEKCTVLILLKGKACYRCLCALVFLYSTKFRRLCTKCQDFVGVYEGESMLYMFVRFDVFLHYNVP